MAKRRPRAMYLGGQDESFLAFMADSLADLNIDFLPHSGSAEPPDVVFALLRGEDMVSVLAEAKRAAGGAPLIGVLPIADERLARRALVEGAHECCSLDGPLQNVRLAFQRATGAHGEAKTRTPRPTHGKLALERAARAVISNPAPLAVERATTGLLPKKILWDAVVYSAAIAAGTLVAWGLMAAAAN